jgi:hypothetical protein
MSALLSVRSRARRCGCLQVCDGRPCRHPASSRIVFRVFGVERRTDACGIHDHLLALELRDHGASAVQVKPFRRFRRRRHAAAMP